MHSINISVFGYFVTEQVIKTDVKKEEGEKIVETLAAVGATATLE